MPLAQRVAGRDRLDQVLYVNAKTVLPNFILNYLADRMEMAHSIEGRVPFLDQRVAEVAARVPVNMKVTGIREKDVLREAAKDVLIPAVYDRRKHPFTTPPTRNTNVPMLTFYRDTFASQAARTSRSTTCRKSPRRSISCSNARSINASRWKAVCSALRAWL